MMNKKIGLVIGALFAMSASQVAMATCAQISASHKAFVTTLKTAAAASTAGYGLPMWVTAVDETGKVCFVGTTASEDLSADGTAKANFAAVSGNDGAYTWGASAATGKATSNQQWLGSRLISAQKANTANAFSRNAYAISSANLNNATNPGGSLYGLQHSNPVDASRAYMGAPSLYGTKTDPLTNQRIGGVNVFGGGLALYSTGGTKIGAIGVSGDTSCRDHAFAWEVRKALGFDQLAFGITNYNADSAHMAAGGSQALTTAAGTAPIGDEMIIDLNNDQTGLSALVGAGAVDLTAGAGGARELAYWHGWSQPSCPIVNATHESYIFIK